VHSDRVPHSCLRWAAPKGEVQGCAAFACASDGRVLTFLMPNPARPVRIFQSFESYTI